MFKIVPFVFSVFAGVAVTTGSIHTWLTTMASLLGLTGLAAGGYHFLLFILDQTDILNIEELLGEATENALNDLRMEDLLPIQPFNIDVTPTSSSIARDRRG